MQNSLISIVLPVYNGEKYISFALDSIIGQSYSNFECIIVDDCSTDDTPVIIQKYSNNDTRFRMIRNDHNLGLPGALNVGFEEARGEYLTWTSDDNIYLKDAFSDMKIFLDRHPEHPMVCANMLYIDNKGTFLFEGNKYDPKEMLISDCVGACFLYRKSVFQLIGGYDENLFLIEDYEYWLRILKFCGSIGHLDKVLYLYRTHDASLTGTRARKVIQMHSKLLIREMDWILEGLKTDPIYLMRLYIRLLLTDDVTSEIKQTIIEYLPEIQYDLPIIKNREIVLYGAGKKAEAAMEKISKEKIVFIVDKNPEKYHGEKDGIPVITVEEMLEYHEDYNIIITVGDSLLLEVMRNLISVGICKFCSYPLYMKGEYKD